MNMKKFLSLLVIGALALTACQPEPELTLSKTALEFGVEGGSQVVHVSSNYAWNVISSNNDIRVSPTSGTVSGDVTVTVPANTVPEIKEFEVLFVCSNKDESSSQILSVVQHGAQAEWIMEKVEYNPPREGRHFAAEGGTAAITFESNAAWTLKCNESDVTLDRTEGEAGKYTVTATVPPCPVFEGRTINFEYKATGKSSSTGGSFGFNQDGGIIVYGGETYHAAQMKDGNWWMIENLRYIPTGMTVSSDASAVNAGIWYPLVIDELNEEKATVKFSTDAADIKANGYLYSTEVVLGLQPGAMNVSREEVEKILDAATGAQGICPSGWHIPTKADILGLVGKTADKNDTDPTAPYYDPDLNGGNGSVALLNADGFNAGAWGAVSIANTAATKGTAMGAIKAYQEGMNTGYIAGSSPRQVTWNDDGTLKNIQFIGLMPNMNTGTFNGAWNNYRNGVSVRCVKNK